MSRETTYFGIRLDGEARVYKRTVIQGGLGERISKLSPSRLIDAPAGFEWGFCGPGPAHLAFSLLSDHLLDDGRALDMYQDFLRAVIARIAPELSWTLTATRLAEMAAALAAHQTCDCLGRKSLAEVVDFNEYKLQRAK